MLYFSVNQPIRVLGKRYIPCVCYSAPEQLIPTVYKLEKEGKAVTYEEKVFFQSGKLVVQEKKTAKKAKTKKAKAEETAEAVEDTTEAEGF